MFDDSFRPISVSPKYPPYHSGEYLEEYFYQEWQKIDKYFKRSYIDIFWTNNYCNSVFANKPYIKIQKQLDAKLDRNGSYFTVCQFDDGPLEDFPEDTLIFSAGGNRTKGDIIPIPLICSPIDTGPLTNCEKDIFVSFVGSETHRIREKIRDKFKSKVGYEIHTKPWGVKVPEAYSEKFINLTKRSKFALAPRGYGKQSFRFYEILQLNAVPVYISDSLYMPWSDELDWTDFSVVIEETDLDNLDQILQTITDSEYNELLNNGREVYQNYFTLPAMFSNILKRLE